MAAERAEADRRQREAEAAANLLAMGEVEAQRAAAKKRRREEAMRMEEESDEEDEEEEDEEGLIPT